MRKSLTINYFITILSIFFCFLLVEIFFRIFFSSISLDEKTGLESIIVFDDILETKYKKNSFTTIVSPYEEFKISYYTNNYGLRSASTNEANLSSKYKILALGNSYVEGWGVDYTDTFLSWAEKTFNFNKEKKIKIINAGISGYGVLQNYLNMKKLYEKIQPDEIIFFYVSTMSQADEKFMKIAEFDKDEIISGLSLDFILNGSNSNTNLDKNITIPSFFTWLSNYSYITKFFIQRYKNYLKSEDVDYGNLEKDLFATFRDNGLKEYREKIYKHFLAMKIFAERRKIKFKIIYLPIPLQISKNEWKKGRLPYKLPDNYDYSKNEYKLNEYCEKEKLDCYFPSTTLKEIKKQKKVENLYFEYDFHLNKNGNKYLGLWLSDIL